MRVTLESHGRDELLPGFDASRSLGWYTAVCPMPLEPALNCAQAREALGPWLAQHFSPENCNAYGYLRQENPAAFDYAAQIAFNYLGRVTGQPDEEASLMLSALAPGIVPELVHADMEADAPLELSVFFDQQGILHLGAWFSPHCLPRDWVFGLLQSWLAALKTLPAYLPQQTLDAIFAACGCHADEVERIAQPDVSSNGAAAGISPAYANRCLLQQQAENSLLANRGYFCAHARVESLYRAAWCLRSLFPMPVEGEFYRVVLLKGRTSLEFHDFSHLPEAEAEAESQALLRAREAAARLDVQRGPLPRARFFRRGSDRVVMRSLVLPPSAYDGWCMGVLAAGAFAWPAKGGPENSLLPEPFPLEAYSRWRAQFDERAARAYWATLLQDFSGPTGVELTQPAPRCRYQRV